MNARWEIDDFFQRIAIHAQKDVEPIHPNVDAVCPFFESGTAGLDGSQFSNFNPQLYLPSPTQVHQTYPSVALASTSVDPPKYGRFHHMELIMTNS